MDRLFLTEVVEVTAAEIRAKYPNPITVTLEAASGEDLCYCVLGAALLFKDYRAGFGFPTAALSSQRLGIDYSAALGISVANDTGNFELAWKLLDEALAAGTGGGR